MIISKEKNNKKNLLVCYRGENFDLPLSCHFFNIDAVNMRRQDARTFLDLCYENVNLGISNSTEFLDWTAREELKKSKKDYINPFSKKKWQDDYSEEELKIALRVVTLNTLRGKFFIKHKDSSIKYFSEDELLSRCHLVSSPTFSIDGQIHLEKKNIIFRDAGYLKDAAISELKKVFGTSDDIQRFTNIKINEDSLFKVFLKEQRVKKNDSYNFKFDAMLQNGNLTLKPII